MFAVTEAEPNVGGRKQALTGCNADVVEVVAAGVLGGAVGLTSAARSAGVRRLVASVPAGRVRDHCSKETRRQSIHM